MCPSSLAIGLLLTLWVAPELHAQDRAVEVHGSVANHSDEPDLGDFFPDLVRNSVGLLSTDNLVPLFVGAGSVAIVHTADHSLRDYFGRASRLGALESAGDNAGRSLLVASAVGGLLTAGQIQSDSRFRRFTYDLAQAAALTSLITSGLKVAVDRRRPSGDSYVSFPSGHTSSAFTIATVTAEHYGVWAAIPGYLGASLVAASRLDSEKHYLSDVVAGATIGYIVGRTAVRQGDQRYQRLTWTPILSPGTRTVGLGVTWRFGE